MTQPPFLSMNNYPMCPQPQSGGTLGYSPASEGSANATRGGNNPYGSLGTYKCTVCRERRKKCEYSDLSQPCLYCASHNMGNCIKVAAPQQQREPNQGPTPPSQMQMTTTSSFSTISALATYYESTFPTATPQEILSYVTAALSQQQQPQPIQAQSQFQAQSLPTQQTQSTPFYYPNTYGNQTSQTYPYNSAGSDYNFDNFIYTEP